MGKSGKCISRKMQSRRCEFGVVALCRFHVTGKLSGLKSRNKAGNQQDHGYRAQKAGRYSLAVKGPFMLYNNNADQNSMETFAKTIIITVASKPATPTENYRWIWVNHTLLHDQATYPDHSTFPWWFSIQQKAQVCSHFGIRREEQGLNWEDQEQEGYGYKPLRKQVYPCV